MKGTATLISSRNAVTWSVLWVCKLRQQAIINQGQTVINQGKKRLFRLRASLQCQMNHFYISNHKIH